MTKLSHFRVDVGRFVLLPDDSYSRPSKLPSKKVVQVSLQSRQENGNSGYSEKATVVRVASMAGTAAANDNEEIL